MSIDKIQTGLRLVPEKLIKMKYIALKETRSLNGQLEHIIDKYIDEYEAKNNTIVVEDAQKELEELEILKNRIK